MSYVTKEMLDSFADHELTWEYEAGQFAVWRLARPGTRVMCVQVSFSPEGIAIQGYLTPERGRNGCMSCRGYGLNWFTNETPEGLLCEKFLTTRWVPSIAIAELYQLAGLYRKSARKDGINALAASVEDGECEAEGVRRTLSELYGNDWDDEIPGYGYDPDEAGWLCATHRTFCRLYWDGKTRTIGKE